MTFALRCNKELSICIEGLNAIFLTIKSDSKVLALTGAGLASSVSVLSETYDIVDKGPLATIDDKGC